MCSFRLPDFHRFLPFRDRLRRGSDNVYPQQYPGSVSIPGHWHQSQSQPGQYPGYFNPSGHVQSGAWPGYASHLSQPNIRNHPSQVQGQYQPQQHQPDRNQHPSQPRPQVQPNAQLRVPPQPQMSRVAQPSIYPNNNNNPYYPNRHRPQDRPEDHHQSGFTGTTNTPFNRSQPQLAPPPVQLGVNPAWAPSSNGPRVSSHHPTQAPHRYRPQDRPEDQHQSGFTGTTNTPFNRSQPQLAPQPAWVSSSNGPRASPHHQTEASHPTTTPNGNRARSGSRGSIMTVESRASSTRSTSKAPQIKSQMLKISLDHPFICGRGHRRSLIPDQLPETEMGRSEKSAWDVQQFSLPRGNKAPMMIDCVQVCSLSLSWDIRVHPSFSKELGRDGQVHGPPKNFYQPLIKASFKSEVCIKTRQDNPLTECFHRWGCIIVESRDPNGIPPTMKQFLYDIWEYFHTPLTEEECRLFANDDEDEAEAEAEAESRAENNAREGVQPTVTRKKKPTRCDALQGYRRFSGLEVCPWFAKTGDLFLYLEPM